MRCTLSGAELARASCPPAHIVTTIITTENVTLLLLLLSLSVILAIIIIIMLLLRSSICNQLPPGCACLTELVPLNWMTAQLKCGALMNITVLYYTTVSDMVSAAARARAALLSSRLHVWAAPVY